MLAALASPLDDAARLEAAGDDAKALGVLQAAVKVDPAWAMARVELGRLQLKLGQDTDAALQHLDVARSLAPDNPRVHYLYALAAEEAGARSAALQALDVSLTLRDDFAEARYRRAGLRLALGDAAGAAADYRRYVTQLPEATGAWLQLAAALEASGQAGEAEKTLRTLLDVPAAKALAGRRLVDLLERQGRKADAAKVRARVDAPKKPMRSLKPSKR